MVIVFVNQELPVVGPVYVLGAGFSAALDPVMPITDGLGTEVNRRLGVLGVAAQRPGQTFEDWLTNLVTPMPFNESHVNQHRGAVAARITATIAEVLDEAQASAASKPCPAWLLQLIALWNRESATIITFNYDTLLERAINEAELSETSSDLGYPALLASQVRGDSVVHPAPPAPPAQFIEDSLSPPRGEALQILKLHGSLSWYWAAGDATGSTLVRLREKEGYPSKSRIPSDLDFSGTTALDRYLIPPVAAKDGYYGTYLSTSLWRQARVAIESASSLTFIGYSMPLEDRVTCELISLLPAGMSVGVVDRSPGDPADWWTVASHITSIGREHRVLGSGDDSVKRYAATRIEAAVDDLRTALTQPVESLDGGVIEDHREVVVITKVAHELVHQLLLQRPDGSIALQRVERSVSLHGKSSIREGVIDARPADADYLTLGSLRRIVSGCDRLTFNHPETGDTSIAIGIRPGQVDKIPFVEVLWAPS